jgi:hypothetical protein
MSVAMPIQSATGKDDPLISLSVSQAYHNPSKRYKTGYHTGIDYATPVGTPVYSAIGGEVVQVQDTGKSGYGKSVLIRDADGTYALYGHLSQIFVQQGQQIPTGANIARSGNTGNSTGPHLHFELRKSPKYGTDINPATWLTTPYTGVAYSPTTGGTVIPTGYRNVDSIQAPGYTAPATGLFSGLSGLTDLLAILTDGQFWIRVLEIGLGAFLLIWGTAMLIGKSFNPATIATQVASKALKTGK